jgi:putative membrane protein
LSSLETTWTWDPAPLAATAVAAVLYAQGWVRLRRRTGAAHATVGRAVLFAAGLIVLLLALASPVDAIGEDQLLSAHMLQHMLLADVGPLLIVLGLRGPIAFFFLPPAILRPLAHGPVRRIASFLLRPLVSFAFWALAIVAWHVPAAYDAALGHPVVHVTEHVTFVLGGLLAWTQIIDPTRRARLGPGGRAVFAFGMLVVSSLLAETLIATGPLYGWYVHVSHRPFDWTAGQDQSHAAVLMMA